MTQRLDYTQISPKGVKALGGVYGHVMQSALPADLVDLVYLRISQINNCAYCLDLHTRDLVGRGVAIEKLALVQAWREAGTLFSERERAALAWAESVTRGPQARLEHWSSPSQFVKAGHDPSSAQDRPACVGAPRRASPIGRSMRPPILC